MRILPKMDSRIDKLVEDVGEIKLDLREHMSRTLQNENMIVILKADIDPIKKHVAFVKGAAWMLGIAGTILLALISTGILKKLI